MNGTPELVAAGLEELPIQVAILDDGGLIRYTNRAWREFGAENEFRGTPDTLGVDYLAVCDATDDPDAATAGAGLREILEGDRETFSFEYPCHSPDEKRWFLMRATAFEHEGSTYVFVFHLNVTERVLAERSAEQRAERLEDLAALLAHDLRNPLAVALGYAEMVASDVPDDDRLDRVLGSLTRMEQLIDDALVLARHGELDDQEPVDLRTIAREAWAHVPTADATLTVADDAVFTANYSVLLNLFENLFRNAVEHGGEEVTVRVGTTADGFYVEDDGPGIPPALRHELFAGAESTTHSGAGLGLTIVATIAEAHGWTIGATTSSSGGARFEIGDVDLEDRTAYDGE